MNHAPTNDDGSTMDINILPTPAAGDDTATYYAELLKAHSAVTDKWMAWEDGWQAGMAAARSVRTPEGFTTRENPFLEERLRLFNAAYPERRNDA